MYSKMATCCYCGTRAALVLKGKERHELACSNCGAPLHELKMLRSDATQNSVTMRPAAIMNQHRERQYTKPRKRRKQRSLAQRFMEEFWDKAEDLLDDIFD